jgi:hypothetical protein
LRTESGKGTVLYREYFGLQLRNQLEEVEDRKRKGDSPLQGVFRIAIEKSIARS